FVQHHPRLGYISRAGVRSAVRRLVVGEQGEILPARALLRGRQINVKRLLRGQEEFLDGSSRREVVAFGNIEQKTVRKYSPAVPQTKKAVGQALFINVEVSHSPISEMRSGKPKLEQPFEIVVLRLEMLRG